MTTDKNGQELRDGDLVMVPCRISRVTGQSPRSRNLDLVTVYPPDDGSPAVLSLSSAQVVKGMQLPVDPHVKAVLDRARQETPQTPRSESTLR
jgi:hypothetical protein